MEVDKEKDVNTINANDNLETEETDANDDNTSDKGIMRKKARKERKKARRDKRERDQEANTDETPVQSPPTGLQRATYRFALPRSALNFENYDQKFKQEHVTASVILKQDEKYNKLTMKCRMLMRQLQKVDVTVVIEPLIAGNKKGRWEKSSEIPFNFTYLGAAIKVAGNARFEKVKP